MKKISLILSILIALILIATYSYATVDATIISRSSKTTVQPGDEIDVSLYLNNLEFSNKGVDEIEVRIDIDKSILEPLTVDSIVTSNGTMTVGNNTLKVEDVESASSDEVVFSSLTSDCDYKIFIDLKNPITAKETKLFTLKCKIKDDVNLNGVDVENAMKFSADIATQVTAQDLKNGMTADMAYKINGSLPLTVVKKSSDNTDKNNTNNNVNKDNNNNNTNKDNNNNNTNRDNNNNNTNKDNNNNNTNKDNDNNNTNRDNNNNNTNKDNNNNNTNRDNDNNNTNKDNNKNNTNKDNSNNYTNKNNNNNNANTAKTILPAAGIKIFILPVMIIGGIAVFSYKKYMKYKDIK